MKLYLSLLIIFFSSTLFAKSARLRKIADLENRVKMLEKRVMDLENNSSKMEKTTGLKVKDYQGTKKVIGINRNVASPDMSLTKEQTKQIQDTIEKYKKSKEESDKILDQIMNEDF